MGTSNFLAWDAPGVNIESDAQYAADALRTNGAPVGAILPSETFNKFAMQVSTFAAAFGEMMAAKGFSTSDANQNALAAVLANLITTADQKSTLTLVPYSPSITLNMAASTGFFIELNGNVTISAITGSVGGELLMLMYQQNAAGGNTVILPLNFVGAAPPDPTPNALSVQLFAIDSVTGVNRAVGPLISGNGLFYSSNVSLTGPVNIGSLKIAGAAEDGYVLTGNGTSFVPIAPLASGLGWTTLPNGDIQQYGSIALATGGATASSTVTFPIKFPNSVKSIIVTPDSLPGTSTNLLATSAVNRSTSGFTAFANTGFSNQPINDAVNADWVAVGN